MNRNDMYNLCYTSFQRDRLQKVDKYFKFPPKCLYACLCSESQSDLALLGISVNEFEMVYNTQYRASQSGRYAFCEAFIQVAEDNMTADIAEKKAEEVNNITYAGAMMKLEKKLDAAKTNLKTALTRALDALDE